MFLHQEIDLPLRSRDVDRVRKPTAGALFGKERAAVKTRERQGVSVTRHVTTLVGLELPFLTLTGLHRRPPLILSARFV